MLEQSVMNHDDDGDTPAGEPKDKEWPPSLLSSMKDPQGYNACILSKDWIDSILTGDFLNCKGMQQAKMLNQSSKVLKMDFSYKLPK